MRQLIVKSEGKSNPTTSNLRPVRVFVLSVTVLVNIRIAKQHEFICIKTSEILIYL